jgi:hypothetical protein
MEDWTSPVNDVRVEALVRSKLKALFILGESLTAKDDEKG